MGGLRWKSNVLMTALFVPGIVFAIFFFLNLLLWGRGSSAAIPFTTLLALLCLWFGISLPLTFFGAFLGFRRPVSSCVGPQHSLSPCKPTWCFNESVLASRIFCSPFASFVVLKFRDLLMKRLFQIQCNQTCLPS